jgi:hypothetical protein
MGVVGDLLGTPKEHEKEKVEHEVVTMPEFDITQYAKKLALAVPVIVGAAAAILEELEVKQSEPIVIAEIGLVAVALFGVSLVMAIDLAARAYIAASGAADKKSGEQPKAPADSEVVSVPAGSMVWLEGNEDPHPLLAIAHDGEKTSSYLVASGSTVQRNHGSEDLKAIDGAPTWHEADAVRAVKPAEWP